MVFNIRRVSEKTPNYSYKEGYPMIYFSKEKNRWYVDLETIDDLKKLSDLVDEGLVIERPSRSLYGEWEIWVHDDYMY